MTQKQKSRLTGILKLVLVAALMAYVFSNVPWRDHAIWTKNDTEIKNQTVTIVGPWNAIDITVRLDDGSSTSLHTGPQPDGSDLEVSPSFFTYWRNLDPWLFALGAFCYFLTVLIAGARWWWLLRVNGMDVGLAESLRLSWIGVFFNTVVPGATGGDVIKAIYIMKRCPGHRVPALVSVIVDRVLGLTSLAILAAVLVLAYLDRFGNTLALAIWGVILALGVLSTFAFSRRLRSMIRLKWVLERLPPRVSNALKLIDQAIFFYRGHKNVIVASLVAGIGNHIVSVMSVVLIGEALGVGMPWPEYFVLIPVINIISVIPLMPNGWGMGELLYQNLFGHFGQAYVTGVADPARVMGTRGVALSVLYRLHLTFWSLLGGLFVLFERDRVTKADIEHELEEEEKPSPPN